MFNLNHCYYVQIKFIKNVIGVDSGIAINECGCPKL